MKEDSTFSLLEIERTLSASPEAVFAALTQPEKMNEWFFGMERGCAQVEQDFRVGGAYTINMIGPEGGASTCDGQERYAPHGEYLEIDPPHRLVFTWVSEGFVDDSTVTINLKAVDAGTKLVLKHELPANVVEPHTQGWNACLDHLVEFMA
ncbi:SRPBCC domain-containing protein [Puniceicoccaceae bacterium K14]|nr:SRPBCC domain-containing protein [Puniceicoccaceae bacterium K14]